MKIAVVGLWHLGPVTAACLAEAGHDVVGIDADEQVIAGLRQGKAPIAEPGLDALLAAGVNGGRLSFVKAADAAGALAQAALVWVTFDTPVDEEDKADVEAVRLELERLRPHLAPGTVVLLSTQVPAGFARRLAAAWSDAGVRLAVSPENLRLGKALDAFRDAERTLVGLQDERDRPLLEALLAPFAQKLEWMSLESAEMSKHALNAFLATSVAFINEIARLCEVVGANAKDVERALKSEPRIGPRAYLGPGAAFAGGTLARDLRYLEAIGADVSLATPLVDGVLDSNARHGKWLAEKVRAELAGLPAPVVALLGLAYRPGTSTLRRSASVALAQELVAAGVRVQAHDPAVPVKPPELGDVALCASAVDALRGADLAVVATPWEEYRRLRPADLVANMRRPRVVDQGWYLAEQLSAAPEVIYMAPGYHRG